MPTCPSILHSEKDLYSQPTNTRRLRLPNRREVLVLVNGVSVEVVCPTPETCWRRYSGLKFFVRADHKYFLLPANWRKGRDMAIIIPEADTIRIEVGPGRYP